MLIVCYYFIRFLYNYWNLLLSLTDVMSFTEMQLIWKQNWEISLNFVRFYINDNNCMLGAQFFNYLVI